jgi:LmbE family N-acetylglucosaminyl deacetylase
MSDLRGVLFVGAHPDDETVMAGGTLAMLDAQGVPVYVVCATDGRGGESGGVAEASTPETLAAVRLEELRCAAVALGIDGLTWLGYEDPVMGPDEELFGFAADEATLAAQVAGHIRENGVSVVISHGTDGEYGHPAHVQVHRAVARAVREGAPDALFYSVGALVPEIEDRLWNASDPAHLALDITPWVEAKHAAMLCHRTQHTLFKRRRKLATVREAIRTVESFRRQWPPVDGRAAPDDPFAALLRSVGAWPPPFHEADQ